jgi:hypothetical protein
MRTNSVGKQQSTLYLDGGDIVNENFCNLRSFVSDIEDPHAIFKKTADITPVRKMPDDGLLNPDDSSSSVGFTSLDVLKPVTNLNLICTPSSHCETQKAKGVCSNY